jgi:integrase
VTIHERKRSKDKRTTRRVSLSPFLGEVLRDWVADHPGGQFVFCHGGVVERSKKRSRTTGHRGGTDRATTQRGRLEAVSLRTDRAVDPLTRDEAHDHFKRTFRGSKWERLRGWHVFRHSFISLLASKGVDQRIIDDFVGHQSEEQRRRYRHLYPDVKRDAIRAAFS